MTSILTELWIIGLALPFLGASLLALAVGRSPFRWPSSMARSAISNLQLLFLNGLMIGGVGVLTVFATRFVDLGPLPRLREDVWNGVPDLIPFLVLLVVKDFIDYWHHRLMHTTRYWAVHMVHHTETHVNFTTAYRVHALEVVAMMASYVLFANWLSVPPEIAGTVMAVALAHNLYVHMNVPISHGSFGDRIIASPQLHQWHHAHVDAVKDKNLANMFSIFDVAFGSYYNPGRCNARFGCDGNPGENILKLLGLPARFLFPRDPRQPERIVQSVPEPAAEAARAKAA